MTDILIKNARFVLTMDENKRVIENGAVAIEGNKIVAVGSSDEVTKKYKADRVIDANLMLMMPGLTNGHNHWGTFRKGFSRRPAPETMPIVARHKSLMYFVFLEGNFIMVP